MINIKLNKTSDEKWQKSLLKALSWRVVGSFSTFLLAYFLTGNANVSALVGGGEFVLKILLFYVHERVWAHIKFDKKLTSSKNLNLKFKS